MPTLTIADLILACIWLFFAIRGYLRGLVREAGALASLVLAFYCAGVYHKTLAPHLVTSVPPQYANTAAYLLLFLATLLGVWFLALGLSGLVKVTMTQWADSFFGGIFGLAKGVVLTAALLYLLHLAAPTPDFLKGSRLVPLLETVSARLAKYIPPDINDKLRSLGRQAAAQQPRTTAATPQETSSKATAAGPQRAGTNAKPAPHTATAVSEEKAAKDQHNGKTTQQPAKTEK